MANIVILIGSVRRGGNTELLAKAFADGACKKNDVKNFSVANLKISPCIGCNSCYTQKDNECFRKDDMIQIYNALENADILVIASPVYFYSLSAQLKAVIDRLHTPARNRYKIKKLGLLLVGAADLPQMFDGILTQYKLALDFFKLQDLGKILVRGVKDKGDITGNISLKEAYDLGSSI